MTSDIPFKVTYVIIVDDYLGDSVTTAIVYSIGEKSDSKSVGLVNIMYNLAKTVLVIVVVFVVHQIGLLNNLWDMRMT